MSTFYSPETDLPLMGEEDVIGHLFSSGACQPSSGVIFSSPPGHQISQRPSIGSASISGLPYYPHHLQPPVGHAIAPTYQPQQFWPTPPSSTDPAQMSYSAFPAPAEPIPQPQGLHQDIPLSPRQGLQSRPSRSPSIPSVGSYPPRTDKEPSTTAASRAMSPGAADLRAYGYINKNGTWSCAYPGCTSRAVFTRGCDLRKHHKRHTKSFFCRHEGCPQANGGGFSSKKDLARHEAKHNPGVICEWKGCDRVFSRVDNMRDHVKRIHLKGPRTAGVKRSPPSS